MKYHFRTFRIYLLANDVYQSCHVSAENGIDEWRFSTEVLNIELDEERGSGYIITTESGATYYVNQYKEHELFKTVDEYMELNGFTRKYILTHDEFFDIFLSFGT